MDYSIYLNKEYKSAGELDSDIVILESNIPDKRTKEYNEWRECINSLYLKYNEIMKFKVYKKI